MKKQEVLIATLGVSPQIVTICLDLLAQQTVQVEEVVSIYTANRQVKTALAQLDAELQRMGGPVHRPVLIGNDKKVVQDFLTADDATLLLQILYREVKCQKDMQRRVHLLIAGGRRVMSAYALVVAQLLFDEHDHCWHLFSDFWQNDRSCKMHIEPGDYAVLVPVPVLRWSPMVMRDAELAFGDDPWQVIAHQQELQQRERDVHLQAFLKSLPRAQREVARLMAEGLDNNAIAARRHTSPNTVTKQVSAIYAEWRVFFGLPENAPVRDRIVSELAGYFARHPDG
ncbi:MAG: CRISPR-associated protein Csx14 [Calditrichaeota bacterium]|nr:MAG: CRISPR-associated protein Csx14 [Calditrichota bacterium]